MVVEASPDGEAMSLQLLAPGETFDLKEKKKVGRLVVRDTPAACAGTRASDDSDCETPAGSRSGSHR
jgi:hypothetical protein